MGNICNKDSKDLNKLLKENCVETKVKQQRERVKERERAIESKLKDNNTTNNNNNTNNSNNNNNSNTNNSNKLEIETHLDINEFIVKTKLGKGSFGQVYLVEHKNTGKNYAMKILEKTKIKENDLIENSKIERIILSKLSFPFIVDLKYSFQSTTKLYLVTEYVSGGDLYELLKSKKCFGLDMVKFYIAELVVSLEYLHNNNCIYRDLKPENILLSSDGHIKLIDFNLSKLFISSYSIEKQKAESICGTADYMAPEIIVQSEYNYLVDWYSLGVITFTFLAGYTPISCKKNPLNVEKKKKPIYFNKEIFSSSAEDFIKRLLQFDPNKRLGRKGVDEIKHHAFFDGIDWEKVVRKEYEPPFIPDNLLFNRDSYLNNSKNRLDGEDGNEYPMTNIHNTITNEKNINKNNKGTYEGFTYINELDVPVS
jgi:serine/threonine protein kinase